MNEDRIRSVAIAGGGMDGWTAAAGMASALRGQDVTITVIGDFPETASGAAKAIATLPITHAFHQRLGIDERQLMQATAAAFTLGTEFLDWNAPGHACFQPLGPHGASIEFVHFHHYAIRARQLGDDTPFNDYSLCAVAARQGRFAHPLNDPGSILSTLMYAHHVDAGRYVPFMAARAKANGVRNEPGKVAGIERDGDSGFIRALELGDGRRLEADLFIDCTGREARLSRELDAGFEDWSRWLRADRMLALTAPAEEPPPFGSTHGRDDYWLRSIPLADCVTHRLVYRSGRLEDDAAMAALSRAAGEAGDVEPVVMAFTSGRLQRPWVGNCIALGAAAGFMEPLSDTRTALLQTGLTRLLNMLPDRQCSPLLAKEYNRVTALEYENIRDFLLLHYRAGSLRETPFWQDYRSAEIPESLAHKIRLFDELGQVAIYEEESFPDTAWASVWLGQDHWPAGYDPMLDNYDFPRLKVRFDQMKDIIARTAAGMPEHGEYLARYRA